MAVAKSPGSEATYRILSLDGGGIRGLLTARWLEALHEKLGTQRPLCEHFNLIAGTSTGAILACALGAGIPPRELVTLYRQRGEDIFPGLGGRVWSLLARVPTEGLSLPKYDGIGLASVLKDRFRDQRFGSLAGNVMVVTYDTIRRESRVLKSWRTEESYALCPVWEVAKSSCSAPTYFPAHELKFLEVINSQPVESHSMIDGGIAANNPTACAIAEGLRLTQRGSRPLWLDQFLVASYGTGQLTRPIPLESAQAMGSIEWAIPIIDVLMDGAADTTDYVARQLLRDGNYYRFQTELTDAYDDLDNASRVNTQALLRLAEAYLASDEAKAKLDGLVERLSTTAKATV